MAISRFVKLPPPILFTGPGTAGQADSQGGREERRLGFTSFVSLSLFDVAGDVVSGMKRRRD